MFKYPLIHPHGGITMLESSIENQYETFRDGIDNWIEFAVLNEQEDVGCFVDEEGLLKDLPLNIPIALAFGVVLAGPVILCSVTTDEDGNTRIPPYEDEAVEMAIAIAGAIGKANDSLTAMKANPSFIVSFDEWAETL